jgi:steroid delta-isomerase-like uncharacterized protein
MSGSANATVIHRLYEECVNQNRLDLVPQLVTDNVVTHGPGADQAGIEAFEQTIKRVGVMFPDHHFTVDDVVTDGDKAAARWTLNATHTAPINGVPPTGKRITEHAVVFYRFENGKIAELWLQMDQLGVLRQIGVEIPGAPAVAAPAGQAR